MKKFVVLFGVLLLAGCHTKTVVMGTSVSYNMVSMGGLDNTCATDVADAIVNKIKSLPQNYPQALYFPAGCYKVDGGLHVPCTVSTCNGIRIIGEGRDSTTFQSVCSNGFIWWFDNTTVSGGNWTGPQLSDFTVRDVSGTGKCRDKIRLTQMAMSVIERVKSWGSGKGNTYKTGVVSVSGNLVTGLATTFSPSMIPGVLQVAGTNVEVCKFNSPTSLSLCDESWPTGSQPTRTAYALTWGNSGIWFDPGTSYTQYISVRDFFSYGDTFCVYSQGVVKGGNSRISITGKAGWCDPLRISNSVGYWLGKHSDTFLITTPVNNASRCWVLDSAHSNVIDGAECENNNVWTMVDTCGNTQKCTMGAEIHADRGSSGYGNVFTNASIYLTGTAIEVDNSAGATSLFISGLRTASFSNLQSYSFNGRPGCPVSTTATIVDWDCVHFAAQPTR